MVDLDRPMTMWGHGVGYSYVRRGRVLIATGNLTVIHMCCCSGAPRWRTRDGRFIFDLKAHHD